MIYQNGRLTGKWKQARFLKTGIFLFSFLLLILVIVVIRRPDRLPDPSNGIFAETFRTKYVPLQKELIFLEKENFFSTDGNSRLVPVVFSGWYGAVETREILTGVAASTNSYRKTVNSSLRDAEKQKRILFRDPLENPVPGDLFQCLLYLFREDMNQKNWKSAVDSLENLFCFTSVLLNSNAPDIYFMDESVKCVLEYENAVMSEPEAFSAWEPRREGLSGKYSFPLGNLCALERARSMRDFEKIRKNGIRLFDGKPVLGAQLKEAFFCGSVSMAWNAVCTKITDIFYDVDRDQTMSLENYRKILHEGCAPSMVKYPTRKMSIRTMRKLLRMQYILEQSLLYLGKSEKDTEESGKVPENPLEEMQK